MRNILCFIGLCLACSLTSQAQIGLKGITDDKSFVSAPEFTPGLTFNLLKQEKNILLEWATSNEVNADHFDIQYSQDSVHFKTLCSVKCKGNIYMGQNYSYLHRNPNKHILNYRLVEFDNDGIKTIYPPKSVKAIVEYMY